MDSILTAFADENLCVSPVRYRGTPEYRKKLELMYKIASELESRLNDEEKKLFEQFRDAQGDENHIYQIDQFVRGYRLGALMMFEVFSGSDDLFLDKEGETT